MDGDSELGNREACFMVCGPQIHLAADLACSDACVVVWMAQISLLH